MPTEPKSTKPNNNKKDVDNLSASDKGKDFIKSKEGCRLSAYKCSANQWTIGYGHSRNVSEGDTITQEEADAMFDEDIKKVEDYIRKYVKVPLTQNQFDALLSFVYNVGVGNFAESTLLKKLNNGDYEGAADEFLRWNKAGGKVIDGLTQRRQEEREMFLS